MFNSKLGTTMSIDNETSLGTRPASAFAEVHPGLGGHDATTS